LRGCDVLIDNDIDRSRVRDGHDHRERAGAHTQIRTAGLLFTNVDAHRPLLTTPRHPFGNRRCQFPCLPLHATNSHAGDEGCSRRDEALASPPHREPGVIGPSRQQHPGIRSKVSKRFKPRSHPSPPDDPAAFEEWIDQLVADHVEPARVKALNELGEGRRAISIVLRWLEPKLD
jgi:hypothetical protein